uniref:tRNA(Ile)-lysidine synthase, chloroplastic n=1 Tax=Polysiphonia sp. TaxID=1967842 RepID=A0A1Z1M3T0_9FLOR|nr:tRNA Ile-lysidine synthetase [Polysiphonia sp.]
MKEYTLKNAKNLISYFIDKYFTQNILLAISGGQDSICLIKVLENLKKTKLNKKVKISYIYIDHQWKSSSKKQIKHIINHIKLVKKNVTIYQINKITSSEDECRKFRYHIILQHALKYRHNLIITGHTKTDQIETFVHNIIKGSEIESLNNLSIKNQVLNKIFILRPLVTFNRIQIFWLCKKFFLPIWSDSSNYIYKIQRNRIRHELIPYIKKYLHYNFENNIKYLMHHYYYQNEYIKQNVVKLYLKSKHRTRMAINYHCINKHNFILQVKTIQIFCFHNVQTYIENKKIIKIITEINKITKSLLKITEHKNFSFLINNNWLYIAKNQ